MCSVAVQLTLTSSSSLRCECSIRCSGIALLVNSWSGVAHQLRCGLHVCCSSRREGERSCIRVRKPMLLVSSSTAGSPACLSLRAACSAQPCAIGLLARVGECRALEWPRALRTAEQGGTLHRRRFQSLPASKHRNCSHAGRKLWYAVDRVGGRWRTGVSGRAAKEIAPLQAANAARAALAHSALLPVAAELSWSASFRAQGEMRRRRGETASGDGWRRPPLLVAADGEAARQGKKEQQGEQAAAHRHDCC